MTEVVFSVPAELRRGNIRQDEFEAVNQGVELIRLMSDTFGLKNLGKSSVLDMGCGCRLVQAILQEKLPIGRYVGVDVSAELIDFLAENVTDRRFHFQYLNIHNPLFNPEGEPLDAQTRLLLTKGSFDIICLFSVFIHLAPQDYVFMLRMLRRYIKPNGRLIFSLLLSETTAGGHAFCDGVVNGGPGDGRAASGQRRRFIEALANNDPPDFHDWDPEQPLKWAIYSRRKALQLVEGTGWAVEALHDPRDIIQHYMVCRPV